MDAGDTDVGLIVRALKESDCQRLVRMDEQHTGRARKAWYQGKLKRALEDSDVHVSIGAEVDGTLVGAVLCSLHYGEFGQPEPLAVLDTVLVDPSFAKQGIASALLEQLMKNLAALNIERLRTEVAWDDHDLVGFFGREGFAPVPRLVLEARLAD